MDTNAPTPPSGSERLGAIDFTKGALVVCMVIYHSLNYSTQYELGFRYLAFLPPSFIFISGFLMAVVYFSRPPGRDAITSGRMMLRGVKLLLLFTLLNVAATFVASQNYRGHPLDLKVFFSHWREVYFLGGGTLAAFEVLLPIAYILLLGPLLLWMSRRGPWVVPAVAVLVIGGLAVWERQAALPANNAMMSAGLLGAAVGGCFAGRLMASGRFWWIPLGLYGVLAVVAHGRMSASFLLQLLAATLALAALFGIGSRFTRPVWLFERFTLLGNYSLLAYIIQIGFLQFAVRLLGRPEPASPDFLLLFLTSLLVTVLAAEAADWLRQQSKLADKAYRFVFA